MKKLINSFLIVSTIALSPAIQAQAPVLKGPLQSPLEVVQGEESNFSQDQSHEPLDEEDGPLSSDQDDSTTASSQGPQTPDQDSTTPLTPPIPSPDQSTTPEETPSENEENEGTPVGQAASEGSKAAKRRQWQNIALATVAIAAAVTALILIANNDGHHKDD